MTKKSKRDPADQRKATASLFLEDASQDLGVALAGLSKVLGSAGPDPTDVEAARVKYATAQYKHSVAVQQVRDIEAQDGAVRAERIARYSMWATVAAAVAALLTALPIIRSWF